MIGPGTSCVFFPIDGFADPGQDRTPEGRDKLAALVRELFGFQVKTAFWTAAAGKCASLFEKISPARLRKFA